MWIFHGFCSHINMTSSIQSTPTNKSRHSSTMVHSTHLTVRIIFILNLDYVSELFLIYILRTLMLKINCFIYNYFYRLVKLCYYIIIIYFLIVFSFTFNFINRLVYFQDTRKIKIEAF